MNERILEKCNYLFINQFYCEIISFEKNYHYLLLINLRYLLHINI